MKNMEFADAFMKGALDAWKLAQKHPSLLEYDYLMARSADQLSNDIEKCCKEEANEPIM